MKQQQITAFYLFSFSCFQLATMIIYIYDCLNGGTDLKINFREKCTRNLSHLLILCLCSATLLLSGCKNNSELDNYKANMNQFFENMKVYDEVNNLAQAIKESKEYIEYRDIRKEVFADLELKNKVEEFEKIRYEEQLLAMQGEKTSEEKMAKLQELYTILVQNDKVKEYFDKEVRFNVMMADVNKTIGEAIKDVIQ